MLNPARAPAKVAMRWRACVIGVIIKLAVLTASLMTARSRAGGEFFAEAKTEVSSQWNSRSVSRWV